MPEIYVARDDDRSLWLFRCPYGGRPKLVAYDEDSDCQTEWSAAAGEPIAISLSREDFPELKPRQICRIGLAGQPATEEPVS